MHNERPLPRPATARGLARLGMGARTRGAAPAAAAPRIAIPDALRRSAMSCLAEALRLCPTALAAKDHGVSCILGKRHLLSRPCQGVYDQGLRLLRGQDIHIELRPPKKG